FQLTDIPPAPRGIPQIEVSFDIDANGIVNVRPKDLGTNKEQSITIKSSSGLSDNEIEDMVKDAEENAEADKQRHEEIDLSNEADQLVFTKYKSIKDHEEKVTDQQKQKAEDGEQAMKPVDEVQDLEATKQKKTAVEQEVQQLSVQLSEQKAQGK